MCLNPVHRQRVCEKLYHKMGYERKKKLAEKRAHARFRLMSSSCVTSLSFSVFFFSVSLPLSRFNKASCRARPSWETQQSVAGAEAELGWVAVAGVQVGGGGGELPTIFPMQCNTQSGVLASSRLFSPLRLLSFHPSINFLSILLFFLTTPASVSFPPHDFHRPPPSFFFLFLFFFLLSSFPWWRLWNADTVTF